MEPIFDDEDPVNADWISRDPAFPDTDSEYRTEKEPKEEEKEAEDIPETPKVKPSPFSNGESKSYFVKAGPCKVGQNPERDKCTKKGKKTGPNNVSKKEKPAKVRGFSLPKLSSLPSLQEPTKDNLQSWVEETITEHPYFKEAESKLRSSGPSEDTEKKYRKPDGTWDPERVKKVHDPIVKNILNPKAAVPEGETPKAVFLTGPFGAGKSVAGVLVVKEIMPEYTLINPDEIKAK